MNPGNKLTNQTEISASDKADYPESPDGWSSSDVRSVFLSVIPFHSWHIGIPVSVSGLSELLCSEAISQVWTSVVCMTEGCNGKVLRS